MSAALEQILRLFGKAVSLELLSTMAIKGSLILGLALLTVLLSRRGTAAVRHYILGLAIVEVGTLPLIAGVVPDWEISPLPRLAPQAEIVPVAALHDQPSVATMPSNTGIRPVQTVVDPGIRIPWTYWAALL